jgi:hypothetical protein
MITIRKVDIYYEFKGQFDGYVIRSGFPPFKKELDDEDWNLMRSLTQDIFLVKKGLATEEFILSLVERLKSNCVDDLTIKKLENIAVEVIELNTMAATKK